MSTSKRILRGALSLLLAAATFAAVFAFGIKVNVSAAMATPYERYGRIKVSGGTLCDESGNPVQLRGMSTHGIHWDVGEWIFNDTVFDALTYDWKCDVIRLAMYVAEGGYASDPAGCLKKVEDGIKYASDRGLYVIVDWHILNPGNPMDGQYLNAGKDLPQYASIRAAHPEYTGPQLFFAYLSQKYGDKGNLLFETANEPNCLNAGGIQDEWNNVLKPYHDSVVSAIRAYDRDSNPNIVICGTGNWDQYVDQPATNPVNDPSGKGQVMYTIHFYAGTHDVGGDRWIENNIQTTLNAGLAVFCTEWGVSQADGNGGVFTENASRWLRFFSEHNISWCAWSLARKNESSAAFTVNASATPTDHNGDGIPDWTDSELSEAGRFLRGKIRDGKDNITPEKPKEKPRNTDRKKVEAFVERLYTQVLGRASEPAGKNDWTAKLMKGETDGMTTAAGFIYSTELAKRNLTDEQFVDMLYRTFFDRQADAAGRKYWIGKLASGSSKQYVVMGFVNSFEWACLCDDFGIISGGNPSAGTVGFVRRMYTTCLGRKYDPNGLRDWVYKLATGQRTGAQVAYGFFLSSEFTGFNLPNDEYVRRLYRTFFDREPDDAGFNDWMGRLSAGKSRKEILDGFIYSNEFRELCSDFGIIRG